MIVGKLFTSLLRLERESFVGRKLDCWGTINNTSPTNRKMYTIHIQYTETLNTGNMYRLKGYFKNKVIYNLKTHHFNMGTKINFASRPKMTAVNAP